MMRLGIFFDEKHEDEATIFSLYQQNHNKLLHRGQMLSCVQEEILHEIILETKSILDKLEDKRIKIDVYGVKDGHENALKFIHYIRESYPDLDLLGYKKVIP